MPAKVWSLTKIRIKDFSSKEKEGNKAEANNISMATLNVSDFLGTVNTGMLAENTLEIGKSLVCITSSFSDFPSPGMEKVV